MVMKTAAERVVLMVGYLAARRGCHWVDRRADCSERMMVGWKARSR
jgi:hypothetical protein